MAKIVAVVSTQRDKIAGGAPIFLASDSAERQKLAFELEKILDAMAHELDEETIILVNHH
ncbi:hypothetical protein N6H14_30635 [Paenibacillus sp. CC-CFT747]|nr:hypothetical protein N6H14_30635 [Paenibacillus sp. CC-CFT747]